MKVIKSDLILMVRAEYPRVTMAEIYATVTEFITEVEDQLAAGKRIHIRGFGEFSSKIAPPYMGRNPRTGAHLAIPERRVPRLRFSKDFLKEKP